MKRLALVCALLDICIAGAAAQDQPAHDVYAVPNNGPSAPSEPRVYVMNEFCTPEVRGSESYPERANQRLAMGDSTIDCSLNAEHELQICRIVRESSSGWGWGEAAVRSACSMSPYTWANPAASDARNYTDSEGAEHAIRTVHFELEGGWRPEDHARSSRRN